LYSIDTSLGELEENLIKRKECLGNSKIISQENLGANDKGKYISMDDAVLYCGDRSANWDGPLHPNIAEI
jgi:hypothetical protein